MKSLTLIFLLIETIILSITCPSLASSSTYSSDLVVNFIKRRPAPLSTTDIATAEAISLTDSASAPVISSVPDYSTEAVVQRLVIYIKGCDPGALFSELKGNPAAATIDVFNQLVWLLWQISQLAPEHEMFASSPFSPVGLVSAVVLAFINLNVNVVEAPIFKDFSFLFEFTEMLCTAYRLPLAFFVLLQIDLSKTSELSRQPDRGPVNLYALHRAILMIPSPGIQIRVITSLLRHFDRDFLKNSKVFPRIFHESLNVDLCRFLLNSDLIDSNILKNPALYSRSKTPRNHPKWEIFEELFGHETINAFLDASLDIHPQRPTRESNPILPFVKYPLADPNHPRWKLYESAYSPEFVQPYKMEPIDL